jgi:HKD family nuclease
VSVELLTSSHREAYLDKIRRAIETAERFALVTAFATSDGLALLEPAMRDCLKRGGIGTIVLALDRQHFNAADVFRKLAAMLREFGDQKLQVCLVPEGQGLLHAKALFAKARDGGGVLIVGSANLTDRAFTRNHELGVVVDLEGVGKLGQSFERFVQNLGGRGLTVDAALKIADALEPLPSQPRDDRTDEAVALNPSPLAEIVRGLPSPPYLDGLADETFVGLWMRAGHIVGRGRRGLNALVIRMPGEQLEHRGLIERDAKIRIAAATEKTMSAGYGVRLLPDAEAERLRGETHRRQNLLAKLTLNLPCFGLWMPAPFWEVFQAALEHTRSSGISAGEISAAAERRRSELEGPGIEREVDAIVDDLVRGGLAKSDRKHELRDVLMEHFNYELARRTPDLLARSIGFRTQRQALGSSDVDLRFVARSFFVDIVQATFSATYRTGSWPRRFRSSVARALAARIAQQLHRVGADPTDALALDLLDHATRWEDERVPFDEVSRDVKRTLGEPGGLKCQTVDELVAIDDIEEGEVDGLE